MDLPHEIRITQQRHRRPDRAAVIGHSRTAGLELGAHRAVEQCDYGWHVV